MNNLTVTLPKIFSEYLVRNGCSVQEIAGAAGVTRATVYNWLNGADARNSNLQQLIRFYDLNSLSFESLYPRTANLKREFDPHSLELLARLEAVKTRFEDLTSHQKEPEEMTKRNPAQGFRSALLKRYGRAIFEAAYRDEKHEGSLILVCSSLDDAESAEEVRNRMVVDSKDHYLSDMDIMKGLGIVLEGQYQPYLSDIINYFPKLEYAARRLFGRSATLRISIGKENLQSNEIKLLDFTWERYRECGDFSPVDYLFYWVSDIDGRSACEKLFDAVKNAISRGSNSLTLAVHEGYFQDETTIWEDESSEVSDGGEITYISKIDVIRNSVSVGGPLDGFLYDTSGCFNVMPYCEKVKVFICNEDLTANDTFDIPEELPGRAFKFLFLILGYKLDIHCDKGGKGVHLAFITW